MRIEGREDISEESLNKLQESIDEEMKTITPTKVRQMLKDVGTIIYPSWNMKGALMFDTYAKSVGKENFKLPENIDTVYNGSGYDPGQKALLQWAMYPRDRRPLRIDLDELFATLTIQQVGMNNPMETAMLILNVARLNVDQVDFVTREMFHYKDAYHAKVEERQKWQEIATQLQKDQRAAILEWPIDYEEEQRIVLASQDAIYWKYKAKKFEKKMNDANEKKDFVVHVLITGIIKHRIDAMNAQATPFWFAYKDTFTSLDNHMTLKERLCDKIGPEAEEMISTRDHYYKLLKSDVDKFKNAEDLLNLMSDGELLTMEQFKAKLGGNLERRVSKIKEDEELAPQVSKITDELYAQEYTMKKLLAECVTHKEEAYVEHIDKINLMLRD